MDEITILREFYGETRRDPRLEAEVRARLGQAGSARRGSAFRIPRPALLLAGVTAAAVAAVGGIAVLGGADSAGPAAVAPPTSSDARTFLLASAQKAERAPATVGRYWYTRERTTQLVGMVGDKRVRKGKGKLAKVPFAANESSTQDTWTAANVGDRTRTIGGIDRKVTFATPADEAKWKAMGSPRVGMAPLKPHVNDYDDPMRFMIGQKQLTMRELAKLPTDGAKLEAELRRRYKADVNDPRYPLQDSYLLYVWSTAADLLAGPITPGTRAALYRVLAEQKGIRMVGKVTDPLGRTGVALAYAGGTSSDYIDGRSVLNEYRLIVDPESAQLLAYEAHGRDDRGRPAVLLSMAYQSMGWTDALGARP